MSQMKKDSGRSGATGLVFVGCLILGFVVGFFLENVALGLFGGLGVGFIAMAIMRTITSEW